MRSTKGWTHNFRPWIVIYCEYFTDRAKAQKREKQLKGAIGREWIWKKIETELNRKVFISASGGLGFNSRSRHDRIVIYCEYFKAKAKAKARENNLRALRVGNGFGLILKRN